MDNKRESFYNKLKQHQDRKYSGMSVGASHDWNYENARWQEQKQDVIQLDNYQTAKWGIRLTSTKRSRHQMPKGSGAKPGSIYHWLIIAEQVVQKNEDYNSYQTLLTGNKYQLGYKKPQWANMSYKYPNQPGEKQAQIQILKYHLQQLATKKTQEEPKTKYV